MGTGNKLNPTMFEISDIYKTKVCPLARVMRKELKKRGVESLKVVYSQEEVVTTARIPASISFVPSVAGLLIASEVVRDIMKTENGEWKIEK
jgi:tRNA A37 threonylcarbamoyladenosine dehydratase